MKVQEAVSKDGTAGRSPSMRPGGSYPHFRSIDDLTPHAKAVYEEAAGLLGIRLSTLVTAVLSTEVELHKVANAEKKRQSSAHLDSTSEEDEINNGIGDESPGNAGISDRESPPLDEDSDQNMYDNE